MQSMSAANANGWQCIGWLRLFELMGNKSVSFRSLETIKYSESPPSKPHQCPDSVKAVGPPDEADEGFILNLSSEQRFTRCAIQ